MISKVNVSPVGQNCQQRSNAVSYKATIIQEASRLLGMQNKLAGIERELSRISKQPMTPELERQIANLTRQKEVLIAKIEPLDIATDRFITSNSCALA